MSLPHDPQALTTRGQRHLLSQLVQFSRTLRDAGLGANPSGLIDLCRCLELIDLRERPDFYAASRAALISRQADIPVFDRIFREFWTFPEEVERPVREHQDQNQDESEDGPGSAASSGQMLQAASAGTANQPPAMDDDSPPFSPDEVLLRKDIRLMSEQDLEQAQRLVSQLISILANSTSRRSQSSPHSQQLDLRRMLRRNALGPLEGVELRYRKKRIKRSRLVLLCDVSGSMEPYSRFLIAFLYAMRQQLAHIEVAVFSTRMTVITESLKRYSVEQSLRKVSGAVPDWGGGTDIGGCLQAFNEHFATEMRRSQTIAVILSDGWDRGDAPRMREQMQLLNGRVHRLLWLNPLLASPGYQPLCQGMRTALPFIDHFLPAHNLESFAGVLDQLRSLWSQARYT